MLFNGLFSILQIFVNTSETISRYERKCQTEGCGRTPSKPQTTASPLDSVTQEILTHRHPCTDEEAQRSQCLNGGECYAIDLHGGNRSVYCQCLKIYQGQRCEEISPDIFVQTGKEVVTASVAAGVVLVIIILVIIIVYYVVKIRKRRAESPERVNVNGTPHETLLTQDPPLTNLNHINGKNGHNKETNV
ncbi:hypothetical protein SNE40_019244 [Patella caerulea]|uniref:EGF-like domain-containing protein n=1 Tax=Patella caerulea TaxID=87958 RepID=A0AAN8J687_PATCE